MADKIVVMRDGEIEQIGEPLDLYDHPANRFVAGFIGSPAMNFMQGTVDDGVFRTSDGVEMARVGSSEATTLGVRPEHLALSDEGVPLTVEMIEPTGAETQVAGKIGSQPIVGVFRERISAWPGDMLHVRLDHEHVHLFDPGGLRVARSRSSAD